MKYKLPRFIILLIFFFIPFFWLNPGEMDLGGDSSRLYFYDPFNYLQSFPLWGLAPDGIAGVNISYFLIPFVITLAAAKFIVQSPYLLITFFNSFQLIVAFFAVFLITKELTKKVWKNIDDSILEHSACVAGIFYTLSPFLTPNGWDKAMYIHNQFFLNPLLLYLLLKFFNTKKFYYLLFIILIAFIFSPNFTIGPGVFAFFPFGIVYLVSYISLIKKQKIPIKLLVFGVLLFILTQIFHLFPQIVSLLYSNNNSFFNAAFTEEGKFVRGLSYFTSVAQSTRIVNNIINIPQGASSIVKSLEFIWFIFPSILIFGLLLLEKLKKTEIKFKYHFLLLFSFFLISLFLVSAKITNVGFSLFQSFFYIPGFSMFRNYVGQFSYIYTFFYAILLGQALLILFTVITNSFFKKALYLTITALILISAFPFIKGDMINLVLNKYPKIKEEVKVPIKMDPEYEKVLSFIKQDSVDGKYLTLPITEAGLQLLGGKEGGAYLGPSTISYLAGKKDFSGYGPLTPFSNLFLQLAKNNQDYALSNLLSILNIKHIFLNKDPYIYGSNFPSLPYQNINKYLPEDPKNYTNFVKHLPVSSTKQFGDKYEIFSLRDDYYLPHIFIAKSVMTSSLTVEDSSYFLSEYPLAKERIVFRYENSNREKIFLKTNKVDIYNRIIKDFPAIIQYPFAKWKPDSPIYPLVILKEKRNINKFKYDEDQYVDIHLFFSLKRISEIYKWEDKFIIDNNVEDIESLFKYWNDSNLINIYHTPMYWEAMLSRYSQNIQKAITIVESSHQSISWKLQKRTKIQEYLTTSKKALSDLIKYSKRTEKQKTYLQRHVNSIFERYLAKSKTSKFDPTILQYSLDEKMHGPYELYVKQDPENGVGLLESNLEINNLTHRPEVLNPSELWVKFGNINLDNSDLILNLKIPKKELVTNQLWEKSDSLEIATSSSSIILQTLLSDNQNKESFTKPINGFDGKSHYLISFDYNTSGDDYIMSFFIIPKSEKKGSNKKDYYPVFSLLKESEGWSQFNAVVKSDQWNEGLFQLKPFVKRGLTKIEVKNFSVIRLPGQPDIFLKSEKINTILENSNSEQLPKISFRKINPTKYEINVQNAYNPYTLVFLDGYDSGWKLYEADKASSNTQITASYYNGEVTEGKNTNIFFNNSTFETWGKKTLADTRHFQAYGYANAWQIQPSDIDNKKEYTLILEHQVQKFFYPVFIISVFAVLITIILLIRFLYEK